MSEQPTPLSAEELETLRAKAQRIITLAENTRRRGEYADHEFQQAEVRAREHARWLATIDAERAAHAEMKQVLEQACIDHGHPGSPVRYGTYEEQAGEECPKFITPTKLPNIPKLEDELQQARRERDEARAALRRLGGYARSCLPHNTPEWMDGLREHVDAADAALRDREATR